MNSIKFFSAILKIKGSCDLTISGDSMYPVLKNGQAVTVTTKENYLPGDILVYEYKKEGLLAHRLLKIVSGRYFCKGDNSFRIEDITYDQILGKIEIENDSNISNDFLDFSYEIGKLFKKCGYDHNRIKEEQRYIEYHMTYLGETNDENRS